MHRLASVILITLKGHRLWLLFRLGIFLHSGYEIAGMFAVLPAYILGCNELSAVFWVVALVPNSTTEI